LLTTIVGALLPIVVILLLGFFGGWHKDFNADQATTLSRRVMLYALPLLLFGSTITIPRSQLQANAPLALAVALGMIGSFFMVLLAARFVFRRDLGTSALLEDTPRVPGLDIPGLDIVSIAKGHGCDAARLDDLEAIKKATVTAWSKSKPNVVEIPISPQEPPLI